MTTTLVLQAGDREPESFELPGPGGEVVLAIGESDGPHSGLWWIKAPRSKSDVYIAVRAIAGYQKWSLHESGDWRYQWITRHQAWEFAGTDDRLIEQWVPPSEVADGSGWTKAFSINVRHEDLVPHAIDDPSPEDTIWLPAPQVGYARRVHVVIASPSDAVFELKGLIPFCGFTLDDGRVVLLITNTHSISGEQNARIQATLTHGLQRMPADVDLHTVTSPRMALTVVEEDGGRGVWDMAVPRNNQFRTARG